jgi:hypothetical protein
MLPNLLVRYAVISHKWVSMTINDPSHPNMPLHMRILNRALVRINGYPKWLNFLNRHFLTWLGGRRLLGRFERHRGCIDKLVGEDRGGLLILQSTNV